ncbi:glycosyltransferase family 2 protein [Rivibacter subsaxonicus]|nr:glycosyltransferase family 2 protein [Rivibacter subsaxonicus]
MRITVITVAYNSAATIADTLASVASQSHPDIEHIVIDGGSRDGTVELVRARGGRVARFVSEPDRGIYDAMNKGLALATGELVGFLNSDDVYADPEVLARIAHAMRSPAVDACHGDLVFVDPTRPDKVVRYWQSRQHERGLCARGWMPAHPTFYARREAYQRHGDYDLSFRIAADFEMCLRLLDVAGLRSAYIPEILVRMRTGGESTRSLANVLKSNREAARACVKHGLPGGAGFMLRKVVSKLPQLVRRPLASTP